MKPVKAALAVSTLVLVAPTLARGGPPVRPSQGAASASSTYVLRSAVFGAAGTRVTSPQAQVTGTLGQSTPIGVSGSANDTLAAGFWAGVVEWTAVDVREQPEPPVNRLHQNYPNPFNPSTSIRYSIADAGSVDITIYDIRGRRVRSLVRSWLPPGRYTAVWDGTNDRGGPVASGVYYYRLRCGHFADVKKLVVLK